jgi:hypothetical protein
MKTLMIIMMISLLTGCIGCRTDRPPEHMMIEMAFFKCEKCRSLEGGIYGKGPFKSLHSPQAKTCVHDWQKISREEFKTLATQWNGIDWKSEIPFWSTEGR